VVQRGIVASISPSQVSRSLREAALQPHKSRYWLNTTEKDPQRFQEQVKTVCETYLTAPQRERIEGTHTICVDEMTGLQALERNAPELPMIAGKRALIEFEYTRHGTLCLIGNYEVTTGELIAPTIGATRTEADFARHIEQTVAIDPEGSWVFVLDNLNIHCSGSLVKQSEAQLVAEPDRSDLRGDHAQDDPSRLIHFGERHAHEAGELHRVFQPGLRETVPLDVHGSSAHEGSGVKLGKKGKTRDVSCFIGLQLRKVGLGGLTPP